MYSSKFNFTPQPPCLLQPHYIWDPLKVLLTETSLFGLMPSKQFAATQKFEANRGLIHNEVKQGEEKKSLRSASLKTRGWGTYGINIQQQSEAREYEER